ncbi:unnamed protein product [Polarella glacialis]|uniref:Choline transporter-like protein n=1 Tax=Polarella glacialis TaxID=89957 RepID=A0A813HX34_POLGL|nr:unnamed protein product [Polarella glacialis]
MSYPTREFGGGYCVPHFLKEKILGNDILTKQLTGPEGPIGSTFFRLSEAFGSLSRTWMLFTMVIPFAAVLSYLFLFLLKIAARPTVVVSLTLILTSLAAVGCFFLAGEVLQGDQLASWREHNVLYKQTSEVVADRTSKAIGTWCILLACVGACALVALRDAINVAVGCVQAACECIFSMPSLVIAPAIEAVCKLTVIVSLLGGLAMLISTAEMRPDTMTVQGEVVGGLTRHLEFNDERKLMLAYYVMGMLWLAELSSSLSQFVISYSVILWYYHPKPKGFGPTAPLVRGFIVALFYHLGSLALGAFMLALLRSVRIIMMWISRQAKNDGSMVCFALASCCTCCITFAQRYLEFLNKNAYIDIALSSSNYCTAAQNALGFISSAGGKVLVLNGACFVVCIAVVLGVGTCTTGMTWLLVTTNSRYTSDRSLHHVENPYFVSAIAGFIGASVALCFMVIFDHVSDTLVYVFVWNRSHGHNTVAKYCPDVLLNLLEYKKLEETQKQAPKEEGGIFSSFLVAVSVLFD